MKIFYFVLILIVHCTLHFENCMCQWIQTGYFPESGYALASTSGNRVYAGSYQWGVLVTTDNGQDWTQTSLVSPNGNDSVMIDAIATNGNYIYAGDNGWVFGVHLSTDYGSTWTLPLPTDNIVSLAVSGSTVYAGGYDNGVYRSTNNGSTWTQTSLTGQCVNGLSISENNIYAGTNNNGVYISTNVGVNWTKTSLGNINVLSVASSGNKVYAGTEGSGVYYSSNSGTNWSQIGLYGKDIFATVLYNDFIFTGAGDGFYSSSNNGVNGTQHNDGFVFGTALIHAILVNNDYVFAGTEGWGVWIRPLLGVIGVHNISTEIPEKFKLEQNYPNPFNPATRIKFSLPLPSEGWAIEIVYLIVYDVLGRVVSVLFSSPLGRTGGATYEVEWDASNYPSGVYFYKLIVGDFTETKKLILLK